MTIGYEIIAFFNAVEKVALPSIYNALSQRFGHDELVTVGMENDPWINKQYVQVRFDGWSLRVHSETESHVLEESQEIAQLYAGGRSDKDAIASCAYRITVDTDHDPGMAHFNNYVFVLEILERLGAIALFDPLAEAFVD